MSWLTSYCPRCQGMLIVPATFVGHSIICDKCGVTFIAMPQQAPNYGSPPPPVPPQQPMPSAYQMPPQQPPAYQSPPYQAPPPQHPGMQHPAMQHPMSAPPPAGPYGYGAPTYSAPPEATSLSLPSIPSIEAAPLPMSGGEHRRALHPFGNPLPEIEILPPPKAKRKSSRKRSGDGKRSLDEKRSGEAKRSRRRSASGLSMTSAPPPLPPQSRLPERTGGPPPSPRADGRISHTALARADHGSSGEVSEIERRIRRAQLRRTMSLAFAVVGLLAMAIMGLLMIKYVKPNTEPAPETPAEAPIAPPAATSTGEEPAV